MQALTHSASRCRADFCTVPKWANLWVKRAVTQNCPKAKVEGVWEEIEIADGDLLNNPQKTFLMMVVDDLTIQTV